LLGANYEQIGSLYVARAALLQRAGQHGAARRARGASEQAFAAARSALLQGGGAARAAIQNSGSIHGG
jgi:hypothetical protein